MNLHRVWSAFLKVCRNGPEMNALYILAVASMVVMLLHNMTFLAKGIEIFDGELEKFIVIIIAFYAITLAFFTIFSNTYFLKPFVIFIFIFSATTSNYIDKFGIIIDVIMIENIISTNYNEGKHFVTFHSVLNIFLFGIVPSLFILWVRIKPQRFLVALFQKLSFFVLCILTSLGFSLIYYETYVLVSRERKDFEFSYQPIAPIVHAMVYAGVKLRTTHEEITPIGLDAEKGHLLMRADKPVLLIVVVGESARSQNFSLNGYGRETNPALAQRGVISFQDVNSCGTATRVSLPCMFSKFGRNDFSAAKGRSTENVLDVLSYAGIKVEWWDNNTGHEEVAARIKFRSLSGSKDPAFCRSDECNDGIFRPLLESTIGGITEDTVLVLHQIGSHGLAYDLRYPEELQIFEPVCRTVETGECSFQEIVNVYDNSIHYTDRVVAETIDLLAGQEHLITSLMYVSDHGESLGEWGLYLHSTPYFLAPDFQKKVPLIVWMSPEYKEEFSVDQDCLQEQANEPMSHDNIFHSILGAVDIISSEYNHDLDFFAKCKGNGLLRPDS